MSEDKKLGFLRVLIAAAWADGELSYEELNNLKEYFRELDLDNEELTALEPYLADPVGEEEARTIVDDFLAKARVGERETMIAAVRDLLLADGELEQGEKQFLDVVDLAGAETTTASVFVSRLKRLWGGTRAPSHDDRFRRSDLLDEFVRNRVLYQVKRRLLAAAGGELDEQTERELRFVCALGALLGHIAGADRVFHADERATIARVLNSMSAFQAADVDIIVEIVESEVLSDVGYFSFARELNYIATAEEKRRILALLFDVAAADGEISHEEHEEIRKISKALNLDHATFIATKKATRGRSA